MVQFLLDLSFKILIHLFLTLAFFASSQGVTTHRLGTSALVEAIIIVSR